MVVKSGFQLFSLFVLAGLRHIFKASGASIFNVKQTQFFMDVVTTTLRNRIARKDSTRNDLIDMMIKAMKEDLSELEDEKSAEQFDIDSELQNHPKTKKKRS